MKASRYTVLKIVRGAVVETGIHCDDEKALEILCDNMSKHEQSKYCVRDAKLEYSCSGRSDILPLSNFFK